MKIIVSHDIDHIGSLCHWYKDLFWEKWIIKTFLFFLTGKIGFNLFLIRLKQVFTLRIENVDALMALDRKYNIPATYFVGVNNVLGMSYSYKDAHRMVERIRRAGFDVGVHGVAFDNASAIKAEHGKFSKISHADESFGIRNHYLRGRENGQMHQWQSDAGYLFDSTDYGLKAPYKIGKMWEFPLSLMEGYLMTEKDNDMAKIKQRTIEMLKEAEGKGLPYFTILMHNIIPSFPDYNEWYEWFLEYVNGKYEFISFKSAINELEGRAR